MHIDTDTCRELLAIAESHQLTITDTRIRHRHSLSRRSYLLCETDAQGQLVAHYRVWMHHSSKAPFREQQGWEKYAPDGTLLDREVRYWEQPGNARLH